MPLPTAAMHAPGYDAGQLRGLGLRRRTVAIAAYALAGAVLFAAYLRLSSTVAENADMANLLLMASDMLHGNLLLHGWYTSDVPFYTTELPQYALLEWFLGAGMETAHIAAAMTYTLAFLLAVMLARSGAPARQAAVRTLVAAGIMLAPQLGDGVYALDVAVGHIGTSVPLLAAWLLLDRAGPRWWAAPLTGVVLAWALVADPLVLVAGVVPLGLAAAFRFLLGVRRGRACRHDLGLTAAAAAAPLLAWAAGRLLRALGGYVQPPSTFGFRSPHELASSAPKAIWQVLELFGADFPGLHGAQFWSALVHLVSVALVIAAVLRVLSRFGGQVTLVDQVLVLAIVCLVGAYVLTSASVEGGHEIAPVEPFAAALAARALVVRSRPAGRVSTVAGALVLAGYLAGLGYEVSQPTAAPEFTGLASWLAAHHLTDGLAGYWDSSSVTADSGGRVRVRPLGPGTLRPDLWMADEAWYDPASQHADFLVLDSEPGFSTPWTWPAIVAEFGRPADVYRTGTFTVLVWHRNLLTSIGP